MIYINDELSTFYFHGNRVHMENLFVVIVTIIMAVIIVIVVVSVPPQFEITRKKTKTIGKKSILKPVVVCCCCSETTVYSTYCLLFLSKNRTWKSRRRRPSNTNNASSGKTYRGALRIVVAVLCPVLTYGTAPNHSAGRVEGRMRGGCTIMSFICASVINHDITKVMGQ
jgi:hypothetical protein